MDHRHKCPACNRPFDSMLDYPSVRFLAFQRLPLPEAVDDMSAAAAEKPLARERQRLTEPLDYRPGGINMTPAIERACETKAVEQYFKELESLVGHELSPHALLPKIPPDRVFRRAYPIERTGIFLSLDDPSAKGEKEQIAEIAVYCEGPNLGSAGGPTLQRLGSIARLQYVGLLSPEFRAIEDGP